MRNLTSAAALAATLLVTAQPAAAFERFYLIHNGLGQYRHVVEAMTDRQRAALRRAMHNGSDSDARRWVRAMIVRAARAQRANR